MSGDLNTTVAYADFIVELKKAKDRIEQLEAALRIYACKSTCRNCYGEIRNTQFCGRTASKALEGKDE